MLFKLHNNDVAQIDKKQPMIFKLIPQERDKLLEKKNQFVRSEDSKSAKKISSAFLSDKNRSFERQTVARKVGLFKKAASGSTHDSPNTKIDKNHQNEKSKTIKDLKLSDIGIERSLSVPKPKKIARAPASFSKKGIKNGEDSYTGLSATNDYVEEIQLGDFTHLNTVENKFYGFYHRIRQKLEQFWGDSIREKSEALFRSGRKIASSENFVTSLEVSLNEEGDIVSVKVIGPSGVKELDDAAIESFNRAGPFPNPPKDLLINGRATISWGFVVKS